MGILHIIENPGLNNFQRQSSYQISVNELDQLKESLKKLSFININDKYGFGNNKPFDLPYTTLKYDIVFKTDSTLIYAPDINELPIALGSFINAFEKIIADNDTIKY